MTEVSVQLLRDAAHVLQYVTDSKNRPDVAAQACASLIMQEIWNSSSLSTQIEVKTTLLEDVLRHMDHLDHPHVWAWLYVAIAQEMK